MLNYDQKHALNLIKYTVINRSGHPTFRREMVANGMNVDKLNLACFFDSKIQRDFCHSMLSCSPNGSEIQSCWIHDPLSAVEQGSCGRPQTSHSNKNCQQRQTNPPPEICPRRAVLGVCHLDCSLDSLWGPAPELPTPYICSTGIFAFRTQSQVIFKIQVWNPSSRNVCQGNML